LEFGALGFGLLEIGAVGVGVFPESKEIVTLSPDYGMPGG
jgi:hypothetical protein